MIIHAHALRRPTVPRRFADQYLFLSYDSLGGSSTEADIPTVWQAHSDGLHIGLRWLPHQRQHLRGATLYKTYEVIHDERGGDWVGVERVGYLLTAGFLPLSLTYRWPSGFVDRYLLPDNIAWLYAYELQIAPTAFRGISPQAQMLLDINGDVSAGAISNHHYAKLQRLLPPIMNICNLADDIRSQETIYSNIDRFSDDLDYLGNARPQPIDILETWLDEKFTITPPVRDLYFGGGIPGPIALRDLQTRSTRALFDPTPIEPLVYPENTWVMPETVVQTLLMIGVTDLDIQFVIRDGQVTDEILQQTLINRFGAYFSLTGVDDRTRARDAIHYLFSFDYNRYLLPRDGIARLILTANEEAMITLGRDVTAPNQHVYYIDFADITQGRRNITITPALWQDG